MLSPHQPTPYRAESSAPVAAGVWLALPAGKHQARALVEIKARGPDLVNRTGDDPEINRKNQLFLLKTRELLVRTLAEPSVNSLPSIQALSPEEQIRYL